MNYIALYILDLKFFLGCCYLHSFLQGSKKVLPRCPGWVDFPAGKAAFHFRLSMGKNLGKLSASNEIVNFKLLGASKIRELLPRLKDKL